MNKPLSDSSVLMMRYLMANETICNEVYAAGEEGKTYVRHDIEHSGKVILGETKYNFWNRLIGCRFKLTFESWALCVWNALLKLSTGGNNKALEQGLSTEIATKAQRDEEYEWVVRRLCDCYEHVCNKKLGGPVSEGTQGDMGSRRTERVVVDRNNDIIINVNANGLKRTVSVPDSTGRNYLDFKLGVVDIETHRE